jgi:hypothetical protein
MPGAVGSVEEALVMFSTVMSRGDAPEVHGVAAVVQCKGFRRVKS